MFLDLFCELSPQVEDGDIARVQGPQELDLTSLTGGEIVRELGEGEPFDRLPRLRDGADLEHLMEMGVELYRAAIVHRPLVRARRVNSLSRGAVLPRREQAMSRWAQLGAELATKAHGRDPIRWRLLFLAVDALVMELALSEELAKIGASESDVEDFLRESLQGLGREFLAAKKR